MGASEKLEAAFHPEFVPAHDPFKHESGNWGAMVPDCERCAWTQRRLEQIAAEEHFDYQCRPETCGGIDYDPCERAMITRA